MFVALLLQLQNNGRRCKACGLRCRRRGALQVRNCGIIGIFKHEVCILASIERKYAAIVHFSAVLKQQSCRVQQMSSSMRGC